MRWHKHGRIFNPADHCIRGVHSEFAQSPQALVLEDFVRIYFSTRSVDAPGKYISHIAFADFTKDLSRILSVSQHEVIPLGDLGCFDEHGIFPFSPLPFGNAIYAYTCGWSRRVSVSVETGIGLAVSHDRGVTFRKIGAGPILTASPQEPCLVGDAFVLHAMGSFHMWHIFGTGWKTFASDSAPDRTYKIGHAISEDGLNWTREDGLQVIPDKIGPEESQALPTVIAVNDLHHMFFCYRHSYDFRTNPARAYRLGHAYSADLMNWTRDDNVPKVGKSGEWDADMQCYPNVFECNGKIFLLYNGNEFGRFGFGLAELMP